jgi:hypothetical protein
LFHGHPHHFVVIPIILWSSPLSWFADLCPVVVVVVPLPFNNSCFHPMSGVDGACMVLAIQWWYVGSTRNPPYEQRLIGLVQMLGHPLSFV